MWSVFLLFGTLQAALVKVELNFTSGSRTFDSSLGQHEIILVNGFFPGKPIRAREGDTLEITVNNMLNSTFTLHYHGLNQLGTPWFDGVPMVTMCPMQPGTQLVQRFQALDPGTHWYHPHQDVLRTRGGYGPLIIEKSQSVLPKFDFENTILFTDWWKKSEEKLVSELTRPGQFSWVGSGKDIIINGQVSYVIEVVPGKVHLLRIISAATLHVFTFSIAGHNLTIIEADGAPTRPVTVNAIDISPGQRYGVLITADRPPGIFEVFFNDQYRGPVAGGGADTTENGYLTPFKGKLIYKDTPLTGPVTPLSSDFRPPEIGWAVRHLASLAVQTVPAATRSVTLVVSQQWVEPNGNLNGQTNTSTLRWLFNNKTFRPSATPPLLQSYYQLSDDKIAGALPDIILMEGEVVDLVIQNTVALNGICEQHPIHLHGHNFWVIAQGNGTYDVSSAEQSKNPIMRDTADLLPWAHYTRVGEPAVKGQHLTHCGWLHLRFVANNPGTWLMHCHSDWHHEMGMGVVFRYDNLESLWKAGATLPPGTAKCGAVAFRYRTPAPSPPLTISPAATVTSSVYIGLLLQVFALTLIVRL